MRVGDIIDLRGVSTDKALQEAVYRKQRYIIGVKKKSYKKADGFGIFLSGDSTRVGADKANNPIQNPPDTLPVKAVINTTNVYDSHEDVHLDGLWKKSLKEYTMIQHLREHKSGFENVIAEGDMLKAYTKQYSFSQLGFKYEGDTQALVFESKVDIERNPFMHNQYAKGWVTQHSVGMQYVNVVAAIDNKDYPEEFKNWKKYYERIGNKEDITGGYFFAVREAKALEGSAVTRGSNHVTPTQDNNASEPEKNHSGNQPPNGTGKIDMSTLINLI